MALAAGSRFGAFDIVGGLGAGGMGEVYLARDRKLGRDVALKILPDAFAADPERLARFEREARVLAALNHPHIAQLHGIEESGATRALVMELVDGEDLGRRLAGGPLPIDEALPIAVQIAEAIDGAHELGIIHRDLKPANIKVRADGTVKVLDFGLAKALEHDSTSTRGEREMLSSPTITSPAMTMRGVILGTAAYMAPEQAKGKPLDKRVDIWAFGCVLYEMLTGRRPFPGEDISDTLAFVLTKDVDWSVLPPATPQSLRTLLRHCLQKNPKDRLRDIGDARLALREAMTATDAAQPLEQRSGASAKAAWAVAAAASIAAIALGIMAWRQPAVTSGTLTRFVIPPPKPSAIRSCRPMEASSSSRATSSTYDGSRNSSRAHCPGQRVRECRFCLPMANRWAFSRTAS
jgi:serine/threonine protein kinase